MKVRRLAGPMSAAVVAACFPGYASKVVPGSPTTEFVKGEKVEGKPKVELAVTGNALTAKAYNELTCYGSDVTSTPKLRKYERKGVDPYVGIGIGIASAALFGVTFASGICDPDDPRLFDFNKNEPGGGVSTSQTTCDLVTAGGTLIGFSGALAYGATSVKVLTTKPETEEMDAEQKSVPGTQPCGTAPIADVAIAITLKEDKTVAYAWTDKEGNANFDLTSLIDPSVKGGVAAAFAGDTANIMASTTEDQMSSKRPAGWAPISKLPPTGEAALTRAHFEIKEIDANIRRVTLQLKVKNKTNETPGLTPKVVNVRAKLSTRDNAAVNGRNVLWENLAAGAEEEKTITIDIPKGLPDPETFDVFLINNEGIALAKIVAKTGPEEAPKPPTPPAPSAETKAVVDKASGQILIYEQVKFATGKATIDPSSNALLDTIAKLLTENPDVARVRVEGHTDDKGVKASNDKLANDRAAAVVKYLTTNGKIDAKRLFAKGYGPGCPMVANDNDDNRAKNRRVEFVILGEKDDPKGVCRVQSKK